MNYLHRIHIPTTELKSPLLEKGESIEEKIRRITTTNEPIDEQSAPMIYTPREDGVKPQYDIRTDRWEIAQTAMDKVSASEIAKEKSNVETTKDNETDTGTKQSQATEA